MTERFEDIFKNKLQGFEENPPEAVFHRLSENKQLFRAGRSLRNPILISASIITIVILSTIYYFNQKSETKPVNTQTVEQKTTQNQTEIKEQKNTPINPDEKTESTKPIIVKNKIVKTTNIDNKYYVFVGNDTAFCGNTYQLKVHSNLKGFKGRWLCENKNATIKNPRSINTSVYFKTIDTYQFIYSGYFGQIFFADTIAIMINGIQPENRFMDTTLCGNELTLGKTKSTNWTNIDNMEVVESTKKLIHYKSQNFESHQLVRTVTSGSCEFVDTVTTRFTEPNDFNKVELNIENAFCQQKGILHISCSEKYEYFIDGKLLNDIKNIKLSEGNHILSVHDKNGCVKDIPVVIIKTGNIIPDFSLFSLSNQAQAPVYFYNQSSIDAVSYEDYDNVKCSWNFGDGNSSNESNPEHTYKIPGTYNVTLTIIYNDECQEKSQKQVVIKPNSNVQYPNVFSPNGDGKNDIFFVQTQDLVEFKCEILSATNGEIIYEWTNPQQGWNGKINGNDDAPEGIYYFVIKGKGRDGKTIIKKSYVYLKR